MDGGGCGGSWDEATILIDVKKELRKGHAGDDRRWLVMFGLGCERRSDQDRLGEVEGSVWRLRHLEEKKAGREGWASEWEFPLGKCFLHARCMELRTLQSQHVPHVLGKYFLPPRASLDIHFHLDPLYTSCFVLGLT